MTKFLLELGNGFSYVGRQYPLEIGGEYFYIDLLFYYLQLRCFVVIELKAGKFITKICRKIKLLPKRRRQRSETPPRSACYRNSDLQREKQSNSGVRLKGLEKPIDVSGYSLTKAVPKQLKDSLPSIEYIEKNSI